MARPVYTPNPNPTRDNSTNGGFINRKKSYLPQGRNTSTDGNVQLTAQTEALKRKMDAIQHPMRRN